MAKFNFNKLYIMNIDPDDDLEYIVSGEIRKIQDLFYKLEQMNISVPDIKPSSINMTYIQYLTNMKDYMNRLYLEELEKKKIIECTEMMYDLNISEKS